MEWERERENFPKDENLFGRKNKFLCYLPSAWLRIEEKWYRIIASEVERQHHQLEWQRDQHNHQSATIYIKPTSTRDPTERRIQFDEFSTGRIREKSTKNPQQSGRKNSIYSFFHIIKFYTLVCVPPWLHNEEATNEIKKKKFMNELST